MAKNKDNSFDRVEKEFNLAWQEYLKDNVEAKTSTEIEKQMDDFEQWYNYVRKQSDTGKTPAEMHREIYGQEISEQMAEDEIFLMAGERFDNEIWDKVKEEVKGLSKKETADYLFGLGFMAYRDMLAQNIEEIIEEFGKHPKLSKKIKKKPKNGK